MASYNQCSSQEVEFILTGFNGLHGIQVWFSIPFIIMLLVSLLGNITVLFIIVTERSLHEPMYYFISILSTVELFTGVMFLPQLLVVLWFGSQMLNIDSCVTQMFFIYFSIVMESSVLALMAYDRYTAVCRPLKYSSIITNSFILKGGLIVVGRSACIILPVPAIASSLPYHNKSFIDNVYCEYLAVLGAACVDSILKDIYLYFAFTFSILPDSIAIFLSYYMIISATLKLKTKVDRLKAFHTCSSHAFVILSFYLSGALSLAIILSKNTLPAYLRTIFSILHISIPPILNPVIYGIKNKEVLRLILMHLKKIRNIRFSK
ncbi:olfactory receptor 51G2-like [Protopterus annectens]|uniref:olfactory receptor 51G2-like n=1 Tax=Protopterus annectens TaxID=7888 RepID=UPI001CFBA318|nr:olfactory receptor 51G2-like [Protopterus annectens]